VDTNLTKTYNAVCAKDGSKFLALGSGRQVSYNDAVYDLIQEDVKATAQSDLDARSEGETTDEENKATVTAFWDAI